MGTWTGAGFESAQNQPMTKMVVTKMCGGGGGV